MHYQASALNARSSLQVTDLGLALVLSVDCDEVQSCIHGTVSHMECLRLFSPAEAYGIGQHGRASLSHTLPRLSVYHDTH